ncbi:conjugal transfer protein TraD [Phyllobacterium sp. SB3]|uniref:conjugal transfer protein TraD n=1 Tax=Phyllobacterium sp. SB3 TaxID=3156073 RepID=UPI0032AEB0CB
MGLLPARTVDADPDLGGERAMIYGALIWIADKLKSEDNEQARELWAGKGKEAFEAERPAGAQGRTRASQDRA